MAYYHGLSIVRLLLERVLTDDSDYDRGHQTSRVQSVVAGSWRCHDAKTLTVPLEPDTANLKETHISMHGSETSGYDMG